MKYIQIIKTIPENKIEEEIKSISQEVVEMLQSAAKSLSLLLSADKSSQFYEFRKNVDLIRKQMYEIDLKLQDVDGICVGLIKNEIEPSGLTSETSQAIKEEESEL